jgi:ABC-type amino acid transport system permease subunit
MVTEMNKYVIILGGIIAIIIGLLTLIPSPGLGWYTDLITLIKGGIGLLLIIVGIVAIFLGKE